MTTKMDKNSTLSRPDTDWYTNTIEKALEKQKDGKDYGRAFDESYRSDNIVIVNAG